MKITLRQLQVFVSTAKFNNISLAADEIAITQAAASMSLSQLESQLGQQLFNRDGKKLVLNDSGRNILAIANHILQSTNELEQSILTPQHISGHVHIGASSTIANYILPQHLSQFRQHHPDVSFELTATNSHNCIQQLLNFEIDIALVEGIMRHPKIKLKPWNIDKLHVFCHPKHPLAQRKKIKVTELKDYPWILRESSSGTRQLFEHALQQSTLNLTDFTVFNSSQAIKNYIRSNRYTLSCLSEAILARDIELKKLVTLTIDKFKLERNFYHACHTDKTNSRATQLLVDYLYQHKFV